MAQDIERTAIRIDEGDQIGIGKLSRFVEVSRRPRKRSGEIFSIHLCPTDCSRLAVLISDFGLKYRLRIIEIYDMVSIVNNDTIKGVRTLRLKGLPIQMRLSLKQARTKRGWTQRDLVSRVGLTQRHISGIESGKIVPRYDTLLELVRILDHDLLMVPRTLVPVVQSLIRDHLKDQSGDGEERSLYADNPGEEATEKPHDEV
jgi:HTH-type transcriptional regulator / antitoxin HipB